MRTSLTDRASTSPRPVVLCLPGTLISPQVFAACADEVPADLVALAWMEAPGPRDVARLADWVLHHAEGRAQRGPVVLAGHSTGGVIALAAALAGPHLLTGLLVAGTGASMRGHRDIRGLLTSLAHGWDTAIADAVVARSYDRPLSADLQEEVVRYARAGRREVVLDVLTSQYELDLAPRLGELCLPVQVVHGRRDRARPVEHARQLAQALPDAELSLLDTGHTPMAEDPSGFAAALRRLLERCA